MHKQKVDITVDGVTTPASLAKWRRTAGSDLPGRLSITGDTFSFTETEISFDQSGGHQAWGLHPGVPGYPKAGSPCTVTVTEDDGDAQQVFSGKIAKTGGLLPGYPVSTAIDRFDDFSRTVRLNALLALAQPTRAGSVSRTYSPGASAAWVVSEIARICGYSTSPDYWVTATNSVFVDAPLQGTAWTMWGEGRGLLISSAREAGGTTPPAFAYSEALGSMGMTEGEAAWAKGSGIATGKAETLFCIWLRVGEGSGQATVKIDTDAGAFTITIGKSSVSFQAPGQPSRSLELAEPLLGKNLRVRVLRSSQSVEISTGHPRSFERVHLQGATYPLAEKIQQVELKTSGLLISHLAVTTIRDLPEPGRRAKIRLPYAAHRIKYIPSIRNRVAREVLIEVAEAYLCLLYLDEAGDLVMMSSAVARRQAPAVFITADEIVKIPFSDDDLMQASRIEVTRKGYEITRKNSAGGLVDLWAPGSSENLFGKTVSEIVGPAADEDWFDIDANFVRTLGTDEQVRQVLRGSSSVYLNAMGENKSEANTEDFVFTQITPTTFKMTWGYPGEFARGEPVYNEIPTIRYTGSNDISVEGIGKLADIAGTPTPILRGGAKVKQYDELSTELDLSSVFPSAPEFIHDMGIWGQDPEGAREIAEQIADSIKKAQSITSIQSLDVFFSPTFRVGSIVDIDISDIAGFHGRMLILEATHDLEQGVTSLRGRITHVESDWSIPELGMIYPEYIREEKENG